MSEIVSSMMRVNIRDDIELARKVIKLFYLQNLRTKRDINKFISFLNNPIRQEYINLYADELGVQPITLDPDANAMGIDLKHLIHEYILIRSVEAGLISDEDYSTLAQLKALHKVKAIFRREYFVEAMLKLFSEYFIRVEDDFYFVLPTHLLVDGEQVLKALANTLGSTVLSVQEIKRFLEQFKVNIREIERKDIDPSGKLPTVHGILDLNTLKLQEFEFRYNDIHLTIDPPYFTTDDLFPAVFRSFEDNKFVALIRRFYDDENWDKLLRVIGALLSPHPMRLIALIVGPPRTGKTLLQNALTSVIPAAAIDLRDLQDYKFSTEALLGKRAIITTEKPTDVLNIDVLKRLVGGDVITIHRKFKRAVEILGNFTIIILANEIPAFEKFDDALADRIIIIETQNPVSYEESDETLLEKVRSELREDVAAFVLSAYKYFVEKNKQIQRDPELVKQLLLANEFRLSEFIADCCEEDPNARIERTELYNIFVQWAQNNPDKIERIYSRRQFFALMRKKYPEIKLRGKYYFKGLRLRDSSTVDTYV